MPHPDYPEHAKLANVADKSQEIGQFIEWMMHEKAIVFARAGMGEDENPDILTPTWINITGLLAEYFEIDLNIIEQEKRAMLASLRGE